MKVMAGWMERKLDLCLVGYQNVALMFLFFPLDETVFIQGVTKDVIEDEAKQRKNDLLKIRKYLVRQTYTEGKLVDYEGWKDLKKLSFPQFLIEVGMYKTNETTYDEAKQRYLSALSASVKGSGAVFIKRDPKDIFCNNFNPNLMYIHGANHDLQTIVFIHIMKIDLLF